MPRLGHLTTEDIHLRLERCRIVVAALRGLLAAGRLRVLAVRKETPALRQVV